MPQLDFERFFDLSLDMLCIASVEGRFVRVNAAFARYLSWRTEDLTGQPFFNLIHPEDVASTVEELARLGAGALTRSFRNRYRCRDGSYRSIRWTATRDPASGLVFAIGRDLTDLEAAELLGQRQRFRALTEHSADLIGLLGVDATLTYLSPAFEKILGHPTAQWLGQELLGLIWPEDLEPARRLVRQSLESPGAVVPWQLRLRHADGGFRWLEGTWVNCIDDPATGGIVINCRDITQRKGAEEARHAAAELLSRLAQQVPGVIYQFRLDPDGRSCFPFASDAIRDIYEVTPDQVRDDATLVFGRLHPDDATAVAESIRRSADTLEPWRADYRVILPAQGVRWRSGHARPERQPDGSVLWYGFITDSTERKEAQRALEESEQRYRVQIEHAPEAIVVFDLDRGTFVDANQNALDLFGMSRDELLQKSVLDLSPPAQPDGHRLRPGGDGTAGSGAGRRLAGVRVDAPHGRGDGRPL